MIYKEFPLHTQAMWKALLAFVKANWQACKDAGTPLRIIVTSDEKKRTLEQNRYYFGAVLKTIQEQAWIDGKQYSIDVWHEYYANKYAPKTEFILPDGVLLIRRKSTTEFNVSQFADYTMQVMSDASQELGVIFD